MSVGIRFFSRPSSRLRVLGRFVVLRLDSLASGDMRNRGALSYVLHYPTCQSVHVKRIERYRAHVVACSSVLEADATLPFIEAVS